MSKNAILFPSIGSKSSLLTVDADSVSSFLHYKPTINNKHKVHEITQHLVPWRLSTVGETAVGSVRRLMNFNQVSTAWLEKCRLHCPNITEGESCQLAFALALLTSQRVLPTGIIATGKLGETGEIIAIEPVSSVAEKFALVLQKRKAKSVDLGKEHYYFFTPKQHYNLADCQFYDIAQSLTTQIQELKNVGIEVIPVASLNEVMTHLNLWSHFLTKKQILCRNLALIGGLILLMTSLVVFILKYPTKNPPVIQNQIVAEKPKVPLYPLYNFGNAYALTEKYLKQPYTKEDYGDRPFLSCQQGKKGLPWQPIKKINGKYTVLISPTSNWKLWLAWIAPPFQEMNMSKQQSFEKLHYYAVHLEKGNSLKSERILKLKFDRKIWNETGNSWELAKKDPPDDNLLMILINRTELDLKNFQDSFNAHFSPPINLKEAVVYFEDNVDKVVYFEYATQLRKKDMCETINRKYYYEKKSIKNTSTKRIVSNSLLG